MKLRITFVSAAAFAVVLCARADDLPTRFSFDRYKGILEHSPFAVATAAIAPPATPNIAKYLYIMSAAKSPDGDMVVIGSMSDKEFKKYLTTKGPVDGYSIANIEWSDEVGKTKATISKDAQYATLGFNGAEMSKPPTMRPGVPPAQNLQQPPTFQRPVGATPPPHVRGMIQRNPNAAPTTPNSSED